MPEHMPVQGNGVVAIELSQELLEVAVLLKRNELVAVDERHPSIAAGIVFKAMGIRLDLHRATWVATIVMANEPGAHSDVVPVLGEYSAKGLAGVVIVEIKVVNPEEAVIGDPLFDKTILVFEDCGYTDGVGQASPSCK